MLINLKLTFLLSTIFFAFLSNSELISEEVSKAKDTLQSEEVVAPIRFGIIYSPFQVYQLRNSLDEKHVCGSGLNLAYNVDYYLSTTSFTSLNFGTLYYTDFIHNHDLYLDTKASHLYFGDISYFFTKDVFHLGLGIGLSYLDYYREYETYVNEQINESDEYEYYFYQCINTSLDITIRFGVEISGIYNIDFRYSFAISNLRNQALDLQSKSIFGLTFGIKLPSVKKKAKYYNVKQLDKMIQSSI